MIIDDDQTKYVMDHVNSFNAQIDTLRQKQDKENICVELENLLQQLTPLGSDEYKMVYHKFSNHKNMEVTLQRLLVSLNFIQKMGFGKSIQEKIGALQASILPITKISEKSLDSEDSKLGKKIEKSEKCKDFSSQ